MNHTKSGNIKKVVFTIHSLDGGGMERVASQLITNFNKKSDFELHLILYGRNRNIAYSIPDNIIVHKPDFEFDVKRRFLSTIKTIFFLRRKITAIHPDAVLSFGEYWNNLVLLASIFLSYPIYIADRSEPLKDLGKLQNLLRLTLYPKAAGLIVQTALAKNIYARQFKKLPVSVIPNPIRKIEIKEKTIERENVILMVGRLINTKHHDRLIEIFAKIRASEWKLILVGGDAKKQNNMAKLRRLIADFGLEERVKLTGKRKDVETFYMKSKIFVFTSSSEGFPNVIGEAMSAGLPVIAYDCMAGPSEIIDDGKNGFLIPLYDDKLFKKKLEILINNATLRAKMGTNAQMSMERFDIDVISQNFLNFILTSKDK